MVDKTKRLERVENPESDTEERQDAADYIEEMWPASLTAIADAAGYSRQHIVNVIESHFREVDGEPEKPEEPEPEPVEHRKNGHTEICIKIPNGTDSIEEHVEAWLRGFRTARELKA